MQVDDHFWVKVASVVVATISFAYLFFILGWAAGRYGLPEQWLILDSSPAGVVLWNHR